MHLHRRLCFAALIAALLLAALVLVPPASATPPNASPGPQIHLRRATFDPLVGPPAVPPGLAAPLGTLAGKREYALVQFAGPIQAQWKQAAAAAGAELLDYIPDYAFIARLQPGAAQPLAALPFVRWVGPYQPAYKLSPDLDKAAAELPAGGTLDVRVRLFPGEQLSTAEQGLAPLGASVSSRSSSAAGGTLRVRLPASALAGTARLPEVAWIEPAYPASLLNNVARATMGVDTAWSRVPGLYGAGQTVAIADTGLDKGSLSTLSADFAGRVAKAYSLGRTNNWSDPNGHGTHVAGSLLGSGRLSGSNPSAHVYGKSFAGVAPEARLVFQSVLDPGGNLGGLPLDLNYLFEPTYSDGARIHSDSWGDPGAIGLYSGDSRNVDLFTWDHKDMTILFAAGNEGTDANGDGIVDSGSVIPPGTAKNAITVGASESSRFSGGYNMADGACYAWGNCWAGDYGQLPISIDPLSNNVNGMAAFSSRGPTGDGRIKPDLVAPGTNIISARSHQTGASTGWGAYNSNYVYMGGTSMATPLAAGAAALVRDWYNDQKYVANPSSALIKATLINGATTIAPGQYGTDATQEVPYATPNNVSGWGRVNLAGSVAPDAPNRVWFDDHTAGLSTGDEVVYWLTTTATLEGAAQSMTAGQLVFDPPLPSRAGAAPGAKPGAEPGSFRIPQRIEFPASGAPPANMAPAGVEMIANGGFESGSLSSWGANGLPAGYLPTVSSNQPHSGSYCAQLTTGNSQVGRIYQTIAFPSGIVSGTLTFWLRADSTEFVRGWDAFWAGLYRVSDGYLAMPLGYLDAVDTPSSWTRVTYQLDSQAIAAVRGKSFYLLFGAATDYSLFSRFCVDDVSLFYETAAPGGRKPFRVTLAWTDYPATEGSSKALVNDLDLEVIAPDGAHYYGNNASPGNPDTTNNVETVWLPDDAPMGTWQLVVRATNVPQPALQPAQPYALVVTGPGLVAHYTYYHLPLILR